MSFSLFKLTTKETDGKTYSVVDVTDDNQTGHMLAADDNIHGIEKTLNINTKDRKKHNHRSFVYCMHESFSKYKLYN